MKFTRNRYQQGSLRRVPRSKGPDVWEFRFSTYEDGARKQRQLTLSTKKYPSEAAVKRKVEALLLKLNAGNAAAAVREPTLGAVIQVYIREEMPERPKSQQNYRFADGPALRRHLHPMAAKVGVPRLGWHTFRHTFRSWLDAVGTAVGVQQR